MSDFNYTDLGEQIKDAVDNAISTGDFTGLGSSIGNALSDAAGSVKTTVKEGISQGLDSVSQELKGSRRTDTDTRSDAQKTSPAENSARNGETHKGTAGQSGYTGWQRDTSKNAGSSYCSLRAGIGAAAILQMIFGLILLIFCIPFIVFFLALGAAAPSIIFAALAAAGIITTVLGLNKKRFLDRCKRYSARIGSRYYIPLNELARDTGESPERVQDDIEKMIGKNMFREAHLDTAGGCLILSDGAYKEYQAAKAEYERKKRIEEERSDLTRLDKESRSIMEEGRKYLTRLDEYCRDISSKELAADIRTMESSIERILDELYENPQAAGRLSHMMDYYLPTTIKLLDVYAELERKTASSENIDSSKAEIEQTIKTLITAYDRLYDDLFRDKAWDISSDISVLNAMLAREGLTDDGFGQKGEQK